MLSECPATPIRVDEYIQNDLERANAVPGLYPIVYDCIDPSPYYTIEDLDDQYIDESLAIEVPQLSDQQDGIVNEPYQKKY